MALNSIVEPFLLIPLYYANPKAIVFLTSILPVEVFASRILRLLLAFPTILVTLLGFVIAEFYISVFMMYMFCSVALNAELRYAVNYHDLIVVLFIIINISHIF